jgi:hypothetical protein
MSCTTSKTLKDLTHWNQSEMSLECMLPLIYDLALGIGHLVLSAIPHMD